MTTDLVVRAQRGDHAAFDALTGQSIDRLYAIARRVLRDPHLAEDAVQECLVRAWRDLRALRDVARFDAWLYRLLLHACRDEQRRRSRLAVHYAVGAIDPGGPDLALAAVERRDELERAFAQLSVEHRMAVVLHHYAGVRTTELAKVLGVPEGTATSRVHYALRALRRAIDPPVDPATVHSTETLA